MGEGLYSDFEIRRYLRRAIALARRGLGRVHPNPMVGALVVRNGKVVGEGWHEVFGGKHAEVIAIERAGEEAKGASLFVSLEPCNHEGKTPACTRKILDSGIDQVFFAARDGNQSVCGGGAEFLSGKGLYVRGGIEEETANNLNFAWNFYQKHRRAVVIAKIAVSLDGALAQSEGERTIISGKASQLQVHRLRAYVQAVGVGGNTLIQDNPKLTNRFSHFSGVQPTRFVVAGKEPISEESRIFDKSEGHYGLGTQSILYCSDGLYQHHKKKFENVVTSGSNDRCDLKSVVSDLEKRGAHSILLEPGAKLLTELLELGLADYLVVYLAPKFFGSRGVRCYNSGALSNNYSILKADKAGPDARVILMKNC